jgi:hypothetical protein
MNDTLESFISKAYKKEHPIQYASQLSDLPSEE